MFRFLSVVLLLAAPVFAADIDGKWTGSIDAGAGPTQVIYNFKADGATLSGSTTVNGATMPGAQVAISMTQVGSASGSTTVVQTTTSTSQFSATVPTPPGSDVITVTVSAGSHSSGYAQETLDRWLVQRCRGRHSSRKARPTSTTLLATSQANSATAPSSSSPYVAELLFVGPSNVASVANPRRAATMLNHDSHPGSVRWCRIVAANAPAVSASRIFRVATR